METGDGQHAEVWCAFDALAPCLRAVNVIALSVTLT